MADSPLPGATRWACSPSGWTDNMLGVDYIKAFDEWTAEKALVTFNYTVSISILT
jgi:hypothetical protein